MNQSDIFLNSKLYYKMRYEFDNSKIPLIEIDLECNTSNEAFNSEIFTPDFAFKILELILTERSIIFTYPETSFLTETIKFFIDLIHPFKYCGFVYCPLPKDLFSLLDSPFPYIAGIKCSTKLFNKCDDTKIGQNVFDDLKDELEDVYSLLEDLSKEKRDSHKKIVIVDLKEMEVKNFDETNIFPMKKLLINEISKGKSLESVIKNFLKILKGNIDAAREKSMTDFCAKNIWFDVLREYEKIRNFDINIGDYNDLMLEMQEKFGKMCYNNGEKLKKEEYRNKLLKIQAERVENFFNNHQNIVDNISDLLNPLCRSFSETMIFKEYISSCKSKDVKNAYFVYEDKKLHMLLDTIQKIDCNKCNNNVDESINKPSNDEKNTFIDDMSTYLVSKNKNWKHNFSYNKNEIFDLWVSLIEAKTSEINCSSSSSNSDNKIIAKNVGEKIIRNKNENTKDVSFIIENANNVLNENTLTNNGLTHDICNDKKVEENDNSENIKNNNFLDVKNSGNLIEKDFLINKTSVDNQKNNMPNQKIKNKHQNSNKNKKLETSLHKTSSEIINIKQLVNLEKADRKYLARIFNTLAKIFSINKDYESIVELCKLYKTNKVSGNSLRNINTLIEKSLTLKFFEFLDLSAYKIYCPQRFYNIINEKNTSKMSQVYNLDEFDANTQEKIYYNQRDHSEFLFHENAFSCFDKSKIRSRDFVSNNHKQQFNLTMPTNHNYNVFNDKNNEIILNTKNDCDCSIYNHIETFIVAKSNKKHLIIPFIKPDHLKTYIKISEIYKKGKKYCLDNYPHIFWNLCFYLLIERLPINIIEDNSVLFSDLDLIVNASDSSETRFEPTIVVLDESKFVNF
ncbi:hypothetical protein EDEG_00172 [Edhazardia aedis USNM 41457]|uniref:cDENN domain-containing protein n=1 Tax=Edhazardia aedis (strain USNM 41457) TaxID=1003232 RepID=J9D852_EDHAE|nr:hypothetical protein EDEG_00172 [Edhazardia aedis USNM 41457]|eukprot:EJW03684.1 hypothetical protein EDEG_00172 [Edhazardia aedis USNM 41457]